MIQVNSMPGRGIPAETNLVSKLVMCRYENNARNATPRENEVSLSCAWIFFTSLWGKCAQSFWRSLRTCSQTWSVGSWEMACQNHRSELAISRFVIVYLMPRSITPTRKQRARKIRRSSRSDGNHAWHKSSNLRELDRFCRTMVIQITDILNWALSLGKLLDNSYQTIWFAKAMFFNLFGQ